MAFAAADFLWLADDLQIGSEEAGPGIVRPVRFEPIDLREQAGGQRAERQFGIEREPRGRRAIGEVLGRVIDEASPEFVDSAGGDAKSSGGGMPAMADQAIGACFERQVQLEAGYRAPAADGHLGRFGR